MTQNNAENFATQNIHNMIEDMRKLVEMESPSDRPDLLRSLSSVIAELIWERLGIKAEVIEIEGSAPAISAKNGRGGILFLCHYDTVHPAGTISEIPFSVSDGIIRGPGIYDMKGGIVKTIWALKYIMSTSDPGIPFTILITPDEEVGSVKSLPVIMSEAKKSRVAMVMEPNLDGNIKKARKGVADFRIQARGIAAHAGVEPEKGASAILELAEAVREASRLQDLKAGTTLNVGLIRGGTATNVVPEFAEAQIDVRVWTMDEFDRIRKGLNAIEAKDSRVTLSVSGGLNRPPMQPSEEGERIFKRILRIAADLGMNIEAVSVGGGSDGNLIAPTGIPVIDGMGMSGGGAHSRNEHADIGNMPVEMEFLVRSIIEVSKV
jgi:glutamate carboxypeptidase